MAEHSILIVEDDAEIQKMLCRFLQDQGYRVRSASNGAEALDLLETEVPDLLISDLLLPGEHGLDLVRAVKQRWFIPTIVLSGIYARREIDPVMQAEFVEAFFEKPVDLKKLLEKIVQLLNG